MHTGLLRLTHKAPHQLNLPVEGERPLVEAEVGSPGREGQSVAVGASIHDVQVACTRPAERHEGLEWAWVAS